MITDAQVEHLITEFDGNMFPKETATFSTPPDRDGTNALLGPDANGNGGVYTGDGDNTVALIDNVRDDNFYDFPAAPTYIAGFFSSQFNELLDRNVMTIDAFDWLHRTTANPADEPTSDLCTSRPARPNLYEGVFAHEWQHLLHYYTDPFETNWVNEGLSDFAQSLTEYVDASATVFDRGADSHIYCFQGFGTVQTPFNPNPRDCGGPENSLNLWGEGNPNAILADYGNAYSLMLFLFDRYGTDFMSRLHRDGELQGLPSLEAALKAEGASSLYGVLHDFQSMMLLDKIVGESKRSVVLGVKKSRVTTPSLRSTINLDNPNINDDPGAAPNGADYVPLQGANGNVLKGRDLRSLAFTGAKQLPPLPLAWTIVSDDPDRPGNPVLWSGNASNTDASAVTSVAVPTADPTLRFSAKYGAEFGFDYGYVQVSTDGGATYTTIPGDHTVGRPARARPERHDYGLRSRGVRPVGLRRPEHPGRNPLRQRRRRERGWPAASTTSRSAGRWSATARASSRSSRPPRSTRPTSTTGTCGWWASRRAACRSRCRSRSTARAAFRSAGRSSRWPLRSQGRGHRGLRRADRAGAAVRAVHPEGQRGHPAGRPRGNLT